MAENLNKIWAKAQSLNSYFDIKLTRIKEASSNTLSDQLKEMDVPDNLGSAAMLLSTTGRSLTVSNALAAYRKEALIELRNELVAGELSLVGIEDGNNAFVIVEPDFWIGADIHPEACVGEFEDHRFRELRVVDVDMAIPVTSPSVKGPKNYKPYRRDVIAACINDGLVDFGRHNLDQRFDIYLDWIRSNRPEWNTQRGFGKKAFEGDEPHVKSLKNIP